jgi:FlaA1/EpsC-like NDP-sugar epimerase
MAGGEIFIPKNAACKVADLIKALASKDYPFEVVGIRPGEKIVEVLVSEEEIRRAEDKGDYYVIHPYGHYHSEDNQEFTSATTKQLKVEEIRQLLEAA